MEEEDTTTDALEQKATTAGDGLSEEDKETEFSQVILTQTSSSDNAVNEIGLSGSVGTTKKGNKR